MTRTLRRWVGWTLLGCTIASTAGASLMPSDDWPLVALVPLGATISFIAVLGGLLVDRRPENAIGWILVAVGFLLGTGLAATQYAERTLVTEPGSLPFGHAAAWLQSWLWIPVAGALPLLILLFPTGRPPSRRWWIVGYGAFALVAAVILTNAFGTGEYETFRELDNPLGVPLLDPVGRIMDAAAFPAVGLLGVAAVASMVVRFRRSVSTERQQLKWFVYAVAAAAVLTITNPIGTMVVGEDNGESFFGFFSFALPLLGLLLVPTAITASILRFRLYDIDRLVSRTLAYAIVTGILLASFAAVTLIPTALLGNDGEVPDAWVAAATLLSAALARPLIRRVRSGVDRRFNRTRYDAEATVDAFSSRLREQVDIDVLGAELTHLVDRTMHPEHVRLWIRP